jgi:hypothetical protein
MAGATLRTVVAVLPRNGALWFFKMRGDSGVVASAKPTFLEFLKSVHFTSGETAAVTSNPHEGMPGMANMDMAMGGGMEVASVPLPATQPKWSPPSNWTETTPGAMVLKSFSIPGDAGQKAVVSISVLGGEGGGILANVNRWRRQLSLPEVAEDGLPKLTESLDVMGGKATFVDMTGTDAAGQPSRMVAASVARGDQTWFYKLTGPGTLVGHEKEAFTQFVQNVRYP